MPNDKMTEERLQDIIYSIVDDPFVVKQQRRELIAEIRRLRSAPAQQLTGDDDSVAHAWDTTPTQVVVDVDRGIAPLVAALNKIPGVRTHASCEGHLHSTTGNTSPYVMLYVGDVEQVVIAAKAIEAALSAPAQPEVCRICSRAGCKERFRGYFRALLAYYGPNSTEAAVANDVWEMREAPDDKHLESVRIHVGWREAADARAEKAEAENAALKQATASAILRMGNAEQENSRLQARIDVLEESTIALAECGTQWADKYRAAEAQVAQLRDLVQRAFDVTTKVEAEGGLIYWPAWDKAAQDALASTASSTDEWLAQQLRAATNAVDLAWRGRLGEFRKALHEAGLHGHYNIFQKFFGDELKDWDDQLRDAGAKALRDAAKNTGIRGECSYDSLMRLAEELEKK